MVDLSGGYNAVRTNLSEDGVETYFVGREDYLRQEAFSLSKEDVERNLELINKMNKERRLLNGIIGKEGFSLLNETGEQFWFLIVNNGLSDNSYKM